MTNILRDRKLRDLITELEEVDGELIEARGYVPDDFIDLTNDGRAVIAKAVAYPLTEARAVARWLSRTLGLPVRFVA
jgi:hypothetical protein